MLASDGERYNKLIVQQRYKFSSLHASVIGSDLPTGEKHAYFAGLPRQTSYREGC